MVADITQRQTLDALLGAAAAGTFFSVHLNGEKLQLPVETLRTMVHCVHVSSEKRLDVWVETEHLNWMQSHLSAGGCFIDVGAATGATCLPTAAKFGDSVRIIAFEPARTARSLLAETINRNSICAIEIKNCAISNFSGEALFREYLPDDSGLYPYLPETSRLSESDYADRPSLEFNVPVSTLDEQMQLFGGAFPSPVVVKIDIEGYEDCALEGGQNFLNICKPFLAIDIHNHPGKLEFTDARCMEILRPHGYSFQRMGHVLLASPT